MLPIVFRVPATIFVIGDRIGRDNRWAGQMEVDSPLPIADVSQLMDAVAAGVGLGSHSWSHAVLSELDAHTLAVEVDESADRLEQILGAPIHHFSYPYGIRGPREVAAACRRYRTAVNTEARGVQADADPHDLCRIDCHDLRVATRLKLVEDFAIQPYLALRRALRGARRGVEAMFSLR
jgi:peptidoglycan/xylan/chitin deacetylase (PgdA/CDA1 family)